MFVAFYKFYVCKHSLQNFKTQRWRKHLKWKFPAIGPKSPNSFCWPHKFDWLLGKSVGHPKSIKFKRPTWKDCSVYVVGGLCDASFLTRPAREKKKISLKYKTFYSRGSLRRMKFLRRLSSRCAHMHLASGISRDCRWLHVFCRRCNYRLRLATQASSCFMS